mmetsp:Transcript_13905/g.34258  ORF Transcript_13905/g.34258 Transcript_13905/m.34258 type:complete len:216 (-) Transcript_13905:1584-2231(-)
MTRAYHARTASASMAAAARSAAVACSWLIVSSSPSSARRYAASHAAPGSWPRRRNAAAKEGSWSASQPASLPADAVASASIQAAVGRSPALRSTPISRSMSAAWNDPNSLRAVRSSAPSSAWAAALLVQRSSTMDDSAETRLSGLMPSCSSCCACRCWRSSAGAKRWHSSPASSSSISTTSARWRHVSGSLLRAESRAGRRASMVARSPAVRRVG